MIKGNKTILKAATLADRQRVYEWCFQSETTKSHSECRIILKKDCDFSRVLRRLLCGTLFQWKATRGGTRLYHYE